MLSIYMLSTLYALISFYLLHLVTTFPARYAGGMDRLQDGIFGFHFIAKTHEFLSNVATSKEAQPFLLSTEACSCSGVAQPGSSLAWIRAERYAHDILNVCKLSVIYFSILIVACVLYRTWRTMQMVG